MQMIYLAVWHQSRIWGQQSSGDSTDDHLWDYPCMSHGTWNTETSNTGFHSYCCYMCHHSLCCSGSYTSPPSLGHIDPHVHDIHTCHTTRNAYSKNNT